MNKIAKKLLLVALSTVSAVFRSFLLNNTAIPAASVRNADSAGATTNAMAQIRRTAHHFFFIPNPPCFPKENASPMRAEDFPPFILLFFLLNLLIYANYSRFFRS